MHVVGLISQPGDEHSRSGDADYSSAVIFVEQGKSVVVSPALQRLIAFAQISYRYVFRRRSKFNIAASSFT